MQFQALTGGSWKVSSADKGGPTITLLYNHRKDFYSKTFGLTVRWKLMSKVKPMKLKQKKKAIKVISTKKFSKKFLIFIVTSIMSLFVPSSVFMLTGPCLGRMYVIHKLQTVLLCHCALSPYDLMPGILK